MAADVKPSTYFGAGFTASSGAHTVSLTTGSAPSNKVLPQLIDAQADPTTGDVRQVAFAFLEALYQAVRAQIAVDNRPVQMSVQRSVGSDANGNFSFVYTANFTVTAPTSGVFDVPDEP